MSISYDYYQYTIRSKKKEKIAFLFFSTCMKIFIENDHQGPVSKRISQQIAHVDPSMICHKILFDHFQ